jgi:antitoxin component YwqK of YwqJK toxin-antitoxin module
MADHSEDECRDSKCDTHHHLSGSVNQKKMEIIDGYTIKYHANGKTRWSKGKIIDGKTDGYWEWYRPDGTIKRSGHFKMGDAVGEWITYDDKGKAYKITNRN